MMVDPDAPTPDDPKYAFWRHWVMEGLQPLSGDNNLVAATKFPVTAYHPPGPKAEFVVHLIGPPPFPFTALYQY